MTKIAEMNEDTTHSQGADQPERAGMPWLTVRGLGLVHADAQWQQRSLRDVVARGMDAPKQPAPTAPADLADLPELLRRFYADAAPPPLRRIPRYARMGLLAALRALAAAQWQRQDMAHTALMIGSAWGSVEMSMEFMDSLLDQGPRLSSPTAFSHAVNNMGAGLISLLLGLSGACQTVTQFDLSFAGAVEAATLELASGRAQRVLLGALDESEARFTKACPEAHSGLGTAQEGVAHEGAVFLCLELHANAAEGKDSPSAPRLRAHALTPDGWQQKPAVTLLSGTAQQEDGQRLQALYGRGPLGQALDVALALGQHERGEEALRVLCRCGDTHTGLEKALEVWA